MRTDGVIVIGAGGHGKVVVATLQSAGVRVVEIWDDDRRRWGGTVLGVRIHGPVENRAARAEGNAAVIAIGDNRVRRRLASRLEPLWTRVVWTSVVHPSAIVHPSASVGAGTVVFAGAVIQPDVVIGRHAILNTGATVDHDCRLGDFVHLAPGTRLAGDVEVAEGALVGIGATVIPGRKIGAWSLVGAGATVVRNVPPETVVMGVPASPRKVSGPPEGAT